MALSRVSVKAVERRATGFISGGAKRATDDPDEPRERAPIRTAANFLHRQSQREKAAASSPMSNKFSTFQLMTRN